MAGLRARIRVVNEAHIYGQCVITAKAANDGDAPGGLQHGSIASKLHRCNAAIQRER